MALLSVINHASTVTSTQDSKHTFVILNLLRYDSSYFSILLHIKCIKWQINTLISATFMASNSLLVFWCAADTFEQPTNEEKYLLYSGICAIPYEFFSKRRELVSVTRAVCRAACSNIFDNDCSGFLYSRSAQSCTLSPYTGEWLMASAYDCDLQNGLEFYRRIRSSGIFITGQLL